MKASVDFTQQLCVPVNSTVLFFILRSIFIVDNYEPFDVHVCRIED